MSHINPVDLQNKIILLGGPTASGKSARALKLAEEMDAVIINADSMQVYREIPIITAQPTEDERARMPHHLYGCIAVTENFSVGEWLPRAHKAIDKAIAAGKTPILVGGTGLYFKSLIHGIADIPEISQETREEVRAMLAEMGNSALYNMLMEKDSATAQKMEPENTQRLLRAWEVMVETDVPLSQWQQQEHKTHYNKEQFAGYFINSDREMLYEKINARFEKMMEQGVLAEIERLFSLKPLPDTSAMKACGIPELIGHLQGDVSLEEAIAKSQQNTRRYAKRQFTWFRNQLPEFEWVE